MAVSAPPVRFPVAYDVGLHYRKYTRPYTCFPESKRTLQSAYASCAFVILRSSQEVLL